MNTIGDKSLLNIVNPSIKEHCTIDHVAVFGSADVDEEHPLYREVFMIGRYLARNDYIVVNGGGPGTMDAATQGAKAEGGKSLGVTFYPEDMPEFEGRFYKNEVDLEIKTADYVTRMFGLMDQSDLFICVQGGTGTLSEWATAWLLAHLQYGNHKPLILYGAFWRDLMRVVNDHFFIGEKENELYKIVETPEELIAAIEAFELELGDRCNLPERPKAS